jgi:hypothetical protein
VVKDARWNCQKCGTLLAWYDPEKDMLRIRYKDHILYSRVGGVSPIALTDEVLDWVDRHGIALEEGAVRQLAEAIAGVVTPGFVQAICRGCGEPNTQEYASPEEVEQTRSGGAG